MTSSVWAQLALNSSIQWGIPYIDGNTLSPVIDAGATGSLVNFSYKSASSIFGGGVFSVGNFGDLAGTDPIYSGGQVDSYIPIANQIPATIGGIPGHKVRTSRGTRLIQLPVGDADTIGEYGGYGLIGAASPYVYSRLAAAAYYVQGASASNPGGKIRWGTKANVGVYTEWFELDNVGRISGTAALAAGGNINNCICLTPAGTGPAIYSGSGLPTIVAAKGSMYLRSDGSSTTTRMYINTDGAGTWTNVITTA